MSWAGDFFGLAKATEGTGWEDPTFAANWATLLAEGKPRGAYHFFHPELDAQAQVQFFMSVVQQNGLEPGDMLVVDSEVYARAGGVLVFRDPSGMRRSSVPPRPASRHGSRWTFWQWGFGGGLGGGDRDAYNGTVAELNAWISWLKQPPSPPPPAS